MKASQLLATALLAAVGQPHAQERSLPGAQDGRWSVLLICEDVKDKNGLVKDSEGGLLHSVPHEFRRGVHSPAVMTIPLTSRKGTVSLDFDDFAFGTSWSQIFKSGPF